MSKNKDITKPLTKPAPASTSESANTKPEFTCIRKGSAPKLRDQTQQIHYAIGKSHGVDVIQLVSNTNNGLFSDELLPIELIQQCLSSRDDQTTFTSRIFHPLYKQKSNNNAGFLGAVLRHEGILKTVDKKQFKHQLAIKSNDILAHLIAADSDVSDVKSN